MFRPVYSSRNHLQGLTISRYNSKDEFIVALPLIFIADSKGVLDIVNNNRALKTVNQERPDCTKSTLDPRMPVGKAIGISSQSRYLFWRSIYGPVLDFAE